MGTKGKRGPSTPLRPAPKPADADVRQGSSTPLLPTPTNVEVERGQSAAPPAGAVARSVSGETHQNEALPSGLSGKPVVMRADQGSATKSPKPKTKLTPPTLPSSESPWVNYLSGKKAPAESFLQDMQDGVVTTTDDGGKVTKQKTERINEPDDTAKSQFGEVLSLKPELVERLLLLVQAAPAYSIVIQRIVMDLAELGVQRAGAPTLPETLTTETFSEYVSAWLSTIAERPLKTASMNLLLLLLHIGQYRRAVDAETGLKLVSSALSQTPKRWPAAMSAARPAPTFLEVLLALPPQRALLADVTAYAEAVQADQVKQQTKIEAQATQIANIATDNNNLSATLETLRAQHSALLEELTAVKHTIADLEKQNMSTRASYQHRLDDTRGRIRGLLQGQITRWLETSLAASRATPPRTEVIEERLEDALKLIEKELQWLQPSA